MTSQDPRETLRAVGTALFGDLWQTPLAKGIGVADRTVRRWVAGAPVPDGAWKDIAKLCRARMRELQRQAGEIPRRVAELEKWAQRLAAE